MKRKILTRIISIASAFAIAFTGIPVSNINAFADDEVQMVATEDEGDWEEIEVSSENYSDNLGASSGDEADTDGSKESVLDQVKVGEVVLDNPSSGYSNVSLIGADGEKADLHNIRNNYENTYKSIELPAKFDLRDENRVADLIEDQGKTGTCWAHAAIESCESNMIGNELADKDINFSEAHLMWFGTASPSLDKEDTLYYDSRNYGTSAYNKGGTMYDAEIALSAGKGLQYESEMIDVAEAGETSMSLAKYEKQRYVSNGLVTNTEEYDFDPSNINNKALNDEIKAKLMSTGAMAMFYYADQKNFDKVHHSQYVSTPVDPDHAVTLIGWDDDFSADNFSKPAPGNGAWICKNSWGKPGDETGGMDNGCFYLSYYDMTMNATKSYEVSKRSDYSDIYQYYGAFTGYLDFNTINGIGGYAIANIFTAKNDKPITTIGFDTYTPEATVYVDIYSGVNSEPTDGKLVTSFTRECLRPGYHTFDLEDVVEVSTGDKFSVVVRVVAGNKLVFTDNHIYSDDAAFISVVDASGSMMEDFTALKEISRGDVNIKAYSAGEGYTYIKASKSSGRYFNDSISVELSLNEDLEDAKIYYTLDGSTPDESSNVYSGAIKLSIAEDKVQEDFLIKARAVFKDGRTKVFSFQYKIIKGIKLILDTKGGTLSSNVGPFVYKEDDVIKDLTTPILSGKDFIGWFYNDRIVENGTIVKNILSGEEKEIVLEARYGNITLVVGQMTDITDAFWAAYPGDSSGYTIARYKAKVKKSRGKIVKEGDKLYLKAKKSGASEVSFKFYISGKKVPGKSTITFIVKKPKFKTIKVSKSKGSFNIMELDSNASKNYPSKYHSTWTYDIKNPKKKVVAEINSNTGDVTILNSGSATVYVTMHREGYDTKRFKIKLKVKK